MYHRIVKRIAVDDLERVNAQQYDALLASCTADVHHRFGGDHALGGERHDRETLREWFDRLGRLFPDMRLVVSDVWVSGWPWDTTVVLRWTNTAARPGGGVHENHGVHVVRMRWGRAWQIDADENCQAVVEQLALLAAHGVEEASAGPLTS